MTDVTGVFEGGGIKGVALTGGAAAALDAGYRFRSAIGTSAGAIVAALVVAGYQPDELRDIVTTINWPRMMDRRPLSRLPVVGPHLAMLTRHGLASGTHLEREVSRLLARRGIRTFGDIAPGSLRVVATDLSHGRGVVFPDALPQYGIDPAEFPVATAVRASSAVPFVFEPVTLHDPITGDTSVIADGGLAAKFPIQIVPAGTAMLGFRLTSSGTEHVHHPISGPFSLAGAVMLAGMTARESLPVLCRDVGNTVEITVDRAPLDFDLSPAEAAGMFDTARSSTVAALRELGSLTAPRGIGIPRPITGRQRGHDRG